MDEPVIGRVVKRFAPRQCALQRDGEKRRIDFRIRFRIEKAHRDQTGGVEIAGAEGDAVIALHIHHAAGRKRLGRRVHNDLVGEHPGRTGAQAAAFLRPELDERMDCHAHRLARPRAKEKPAYFFGAGGCFCPALALNAARCSFVQVGNVLRAIR